MMWLKSQQYRRKLRWGQIVEEIILKKRVCVFCFYNEKGIIEQYVCDLLQQLKEVSQRIIIVSNGSIEVEETKKLREYSNEIIQRENIGLDIGAYKDVFEKYLSVEEASMYDDLVLCNDTFYGFFTPLEYIFNKMDAKNVDIWGLNIIDRVLIKHIQSYFLVFSGKGIKAIYEYFKNAEYVSSYGEAVAFIETRLLKYFESKNLKYAAYTDIHCTDVYTNPYDCVVKYGLPILKRKCIEEQECNPEILQKTLTFLINDKHYKYNLPKLKVVKGNDVKTKKVAQSLVTEEELISWANKGPFFIFGEGKMGQLLYYTYFKDNPNFKGYVVKNKTKTALGYGEIDKFSRIIIGVQQNTQEEIINMLPGTMEIMRLWDI